ncbi:ionic transporter y4hA [Kaistia dalseonensis]|uniref:Ca2+:H+ antiporter n=1 Tax=Kaistia dalseonensis TaxID=410840 RepID=A0ABU0H7N5_9HYPH|nr:ionic transporter y4hA [Kaistia dalseonensis]MCX5495726.1 ionic transporter y4hA [Kaistia dalseonensis]MDQ0438323.1 Ca2+:H+ antiporter [Kaistia dalseonensis]
MIAMVGAILVLAAHALDLFGETSGLFVALAGLFLIGSVFAAVEHAEVISHRIGEPFGSIVLAAAVTVIEVSLIVSIMLSGAAEGSEIARDTVFATVMIVLNGVVGICLLAGGLLYREQEFHNTGAAAALAVLGTLTTLTLILPNFTTSVPGPFYSPLQLGFVAIVSLILYGLFLFVQTVRHRDYFLDVDTGPATEKPSNRAAAFSALMLLVALLIVILVAEDLTPTISSAVASAGLNPQLIGVLVAAVVLLPEGTTAFRAARANKVQRSLNLALGSALASIGLSIPTIAIISMLLGKPITLGLEGDHVVQIVLTLLISTITLATGRTTILQGGVHLVIFAVFVFIAAAP